MNVRRMQKSNAKWKLKVARKMSAGSAMIQMKRTQKYSLNNFPVFFLHSENNMKMKFTSPAIAISQMKNKSSSDRFVSLCPSAYNMNARKNAES